MFVNDFQNYIMIDELRGQDNYQHAESIANHYSKISNQYEQINSEYFPSFQNTDNFPQVEPLKVYQAICSMNKTAATVPGDIPKRLISEFSVEITFPLSEIISSCFKSGVYPNLFKVEHVTPVPKMYPARKVIWF